MDAPRRRAPDFLVSTAFQLLGGFGIVAQLMVGQRGLQALLQAQNGDGSFLSILPWAVALSGISTCSSAPPRSSGTGRSSWARSWAATSRSASAAYLGGSSREAPPEPV